MHAFGGKFANRIPMALADTRGSELSISTEIHAISDIISGNTGFVVRAE
jgi:hypothetical protein